MIPTSNIPPRPSRRIVLLSKLKTTTLRFRSVTGAFFRKGDELEATGFESLPHDDPTLAPPKLGFRSFDRVPRNRGPLLIAILLLSGTAVGVLGWRSVRHLPNETARVATSLRGKASGEWVRLKASVGSRPAAP